MGRIGHYIINAVLLLFIGGSSVLGDKVSIPYCTMSQTSECCCNHHEGEPKTDCERWVNMTCCTVSEYEVPKTSATSLVQKHFSFQGILLFLGKEIGISNNRIFRGNSFLRQNNFSSTALQRRVKLCSFLN